jgi:hypothetical protein
MWDMIVGHRTKDENVRLSCTIWDMWSPYCAGVSGPCYVLNDVEAKEREAHDLLHYSPIDVDGGVLSPLSPVVLFSLVLIALRERLVSWHHTAMSLTSL